jgi:hypothetical protein
MEMRLKSWFSVPVLRNNLFILDDSDFESTHMSENSDGSVPRKQA